MAIQKAHKKLVEMLLSQAKGSDYVKIPLKKFAGLYNIQDYMEDEEELEFVIEDILMELSEYELKIKKTGEELLLPQCGIIKADYPGDGEKVIFKLDKAVVDADTFEIVE